MKHVLFVWAMVCASVTANGAPSGRADSPRCEREIFGRMDDGTEVGIYTLRNDSGMIVKVIDLGATLAQVWLPSHDGSPVDVVVGFKDLTGYAHRPSFIGSTIGRVANRIAGASFTLDGTTYRLEANSGGKNTLHGGSHGFDKRIWHSEIAAGKEPAVDFTLESSDGESGFPGNLHVRVRYTLAAENTLRIDYEATTDRPTPINLTNHSFFNLAGKGNVLGQHLEIAADAYTPTDATLIPTGEIASVAGTWLDFRAAHRIGERITATNGGYDHNFVLRQTGPGLHFAARLEDPVSQRKLEIWTTEPGMQVNTANRFDGKLVGATGLPIGPYGGCAFETQHFPDAVHRPNFPSIILRPSQVYRSTTEFRFQAP